MITLLRPALIVCLLAPNGVSAEREAKARAVLLVANKHDDTLCFIDPGTLQIAQTIATGPNPHEIVVTPNQRFAYLSNYAPPGNTISVIDLATHQPIETFDCPGMPVRIRFTDDGKFALVPNWQKEGQLIVIDTATHKEIKRVKVGGFAIGVEITPDGRRAFVGCEHADGVHVIDMARLIVEKVIKTGNGPDPMAWWVPPGS